MWMTAGAAATLATAGAAATAAEALPMPTQTVLQMRSCRTTA